MSDAALRDLAARAAAGDGRARAELGRAAREQARAILADGRFHEGHHHGGFLRGVFSRLGDWLGSVTGAMPGGAALGWLVLAAVVAGVVAVAASAVLRRGAAGAPRNAAAADPAVAGAGPDALERRAAQAERDGDLDAAVRLRFQAGLLRLHAARAIELRPSLTSGQIARRLESARFTGLARTHDAVAYGGRAAQDEDAGRAREDWPAVVAEARRR